MTSRIARTIVGLAPNTTYHYAVDAALANGVALGLRGPVGTFTTRR